MQGYQLFKKNIKKLAVKPFVKATQILCIVVCFVSATMKKGRYVVYVHISHHGWGVGIEAGSW